MHIDACEFALSQYCNELIKFLVLYLLEEIMLDCQKQIVFPLLELNLLDLMRL